MSDVAEETNSDAALRVEPAIRHQYRVMGFGVERVVKGEYVELHLNFLVTPIEAVIIEIPEETKTDLVEALTGGIVIPQLRLPSGDPEYGLIQS